jgi:hypothetical protein
LPLCRCFASTLRIRCLTRMQSCGCAGSCIVAKEGNLSPRERKKLSNLADLAHQSVRDVILSRGGTAANARKAGHWADRLLIEAVRAALDGDATAESAVKIAKQARRLGQKGES